MSALEIRDLVVMFGSGAHATAAVDRVSLTVEAGSVVGLVGESGSGKSTLARAIVGLAPISSGEILLDGEPIHPPDGRLTRSMRVRRRRIQLVFQDPYGALSPRRSIGSSIAEGVTAAGGGRRVDLRAEVRSLMELVRLDPKHENLLPRQLSGGQRQRVAIARALAARPEVLIADEITSALDVSVQGAALNLVRDVQQETGVSILFISHNLAVVRYMSERIAVMKDGRIVESSAADDITLRPTHPYTQQLVAAVPSMDSGRFHQGRNGTRKMLPGEAR
ncbi:ABC transporter ATP-binding protein [Streptomyces sp. NPDC004752]